MGLINPTLPTIGQPNSTEDVDLLNCLTAILAEFNGHVGPANLEAGAALANLGSSIVEANMATGASGLAKGSFSAYRAANYTPASPGPVLFNTEEWDPSNWYDTATGKFTPQVAGYYRLTARLRTSFSNGGETYSFAKNGTAIKDLEFGISPTAIGVNGASSALVQANGSTDFFTVAVSSWAIAVLGGAAQSYFQGELVGRS